MIAGFSHLAVWVVRSGPSGENTWLIEACLVGLKGLEPEIKTSLASTHRRPMECAVFEEKFRAEENGARRIDVVERVAGTERRYTFDEAFLVPGLPDRPPFDMIRFRK